MPSIGLNSGYSQPIKTGIKVRYEKKKLPVEIVFGGPNGTGGNLFGFGVTTGPNKKQLFRQDSHDPRNHKGKGELDYWPRGEWPAYKYHYHVYRFTDSGI